MKKLIIFMVLFFVGFAAANAQNQRFYDDRYFYDEDFDWHWDVRVRISDGVNSGLLTNWESKRLYTKPERIEEKEYRYMADGHYDNWEQDDIWSDVVWLNRRVGIELYDYDRRFYGFNGIYIGFNTYPFWYNRYYSSGWNFYRFDRLGWGSYRYGYAPRYYYPQTNIYVHKNYNNGRQSSPTYNSRNNANVVRRDRTDRANRVGTYNNGTYRRNTTTTKPSTGSRSSERTYSSPSSGRSSSPAPSVRSSGSSSRSSSPAPSVRSSGSSSRSSSPAPSVRSSSSSSRSSSPAPSVRSSSSSSRSSSPAPSVRSSSSSSRSSSPASSSSRSSGSSRSPR